MKKRFFFLVLMLIFLAPGARAEDILTFYFERSGGVLMLDPQVPKTIVLESDPNFSIIDFSKNLVSGEYRIDLTDVSGAQALSYQFSGQDGSFSYTMPHFGIVNGYRIYSTQNSQLLLKGSLEEFVRCNADTICEFEKGENLNTCLSDCVSGNFSEETKKLLKQNNNVLTDSKTGEILLRGTQPVATPGVFGGEASGKGRVVALIIGGVAMLLIGLGIFALFRLRRRNRQYGL